MSREIDERIVAMYFDNKDFEKNAHTTIDTLGQLKQSLDLEGAAKGMEELQKAGRRLDFTKVENSARSLKNTLGGIGNVMSKAFDIGTAPLQHLNNLISKFRGYAGKVIGFDVASKVVGGVENALREVTIQPITAGWHEYELKMDSIKTIMSGSGESLDKVKAKLEELNQYADKTIYSFSDMTSNIGKFVNNGVELGKATSAMKGIANAAADAGQGAAEASRAMYNISQAFGVGSMKLVDWKSIENANMATQKLKDTFLQLGGAMGKLQQFTDKEGNIHYFYQDEGKKAPSTAGLEKMTPQQIEAWFKKNNIDEITAKNFRESLNKNWLTNEVMEAGFRVYSGDINNATELMSMIPGLTQAQADALFKIGQEAMEAATQVRTFSKMWDALKEAAQSGWAQSLEYVFGDMEEATKLWTDLNDMFSKAIGDSADARNEMLMAWRGLQKMDDGTYEKIQGQFDGRDQLIYALKSMIRLIGSFKQTFSEAWTAVFGKLDGRKLANLSQQLNYFVNRLTVWFGQTAKGGTRLEKIKMGLQGVFTVIKVGITFVKSAFDLVKRFLGPIADVAITAFGKIGEKLSELKDLNVGQIFKKLGEWAGKLWDKITHLDFGEALSKVGEWFSGIWERTKGTIRQWMQDNDLQGLLDFLKKIRSRISSIWNSVKSWEGWAAIGQFFGNIWGWLSEQFSSKKRYDANGHELADDRPPVLVMLSNVWEGVKKIWNAITRWGGWKKIADLFGNAWGWIKKQFTADESTGEVPILVFFRNAWNGIVDIWNQLSGWEGWQKIGEFFSGIWESITGLFAGVNLEEFDLVTFLKNIWHGLEEVWGNITKWYEDAGIGDFFRGLWGSINSLFTGGEVQHGYRNGKLESWYADPPIVAFFKNLINSISKAWDEVVAWPVWKTIGTFLSDTWTWIVTQFRPTRNVVSGYRNGRLESWYEESDSPIVAFFKNIISSVSKAWDEIVKWPVWKTIGTFLSDTWTWIVTQFSPTKKVVSGYRNGRLESWYEESASPVSQFLSNTWESVKNVWKQIVEWEGWKSIGKFLSDTWGWITSLFKGESMTTNEAGQVIPVEGIATIGKETKDALKKAPEEKELNLLQRVLETLRGFWETVRQTADKVTGNNTVTRLWDSLGRMFESIVNLFELVSKIALWATENPVYAGIIALVVTIIKGWFGKQQLKMTTQLATIASNTDSLGTQIMKIGIGFGIIAAAVYALGELDRDKLIQGGAAFVVIAGVAGGLLIALKSFNDSRPAVADEPVKAWERVVSNLIKWVGIAGSIAIAMSLLPNIIKSFGEVKKYAPDLNGGDIASTLLGLTALIGGTSLVLAAVDKISGGKGLNPVAALKTALAVLGFIGSILAAFTVEGVLADAINGGLDYLVDKIDAAADIMSKLGEGLGRFFGAIVGGFTGQKDASQMNTQLAGLKEGTEAASEISQEKLQHLGIVMNMLGTIQDSLPDYNGILDKWLNGSKLQDLGNQLPTLGLGLAGFIGYIGDVQLDKFEQLRESLNALSLFVSVVETMQKALSELNGSNMFVNAPRTWKEWEQVLDTVTSQKYLDAATALAAAIQKGLGGEDGKFEGLEFNAMPIVEAITAAIGLGDTAIAIAVRDMVQHGLDALNTPEFTEGKDGFKVPESVTNTFTEMSELTKQFEGLWGTDTTTGQTNTFTDFAKGLLGDTSQLLGENGAISQTVGDLEKEFGKLNPQKLLSWKDDQGNDIDMTGELNKMLGELQTAVDQMPSFEIRITPVFDMSHLNGNTIENLLAQRTIGIGVKMPKLQVEIDSDQSLTELRGINQRLDQLSAKITQENASNMLAIYNTARHVDALGVNINGLGARIAAMKLYLYPNQLVGGLIGQIDAALGQRAGITSRTGVSPGTAVTGAATTISPP